MSSKSIVKAVEDQDWLEPVGTAVQKAVTTLYKAGGEPANAVKNVLHGSTFGHPIHPIKAGAVVGAWSIAAVLDVCESLGNRKAGDGADAAVGIGLLFAASSAITGLTDYTGIDDKPRKRIGAMHAMVNGTATLLYGASYLLRRSNQRTLAKALAGVGYGIMAFGGYLGGVLVFEQGVGVDHADRENLPQDWVAVAEVSDIPHGSSKVIEVNGNPVLIAHTKGKYRAIGNTCAHLGGPLNEGKIANGMVTCPWHGSCFKLDTGAIVDGPTAYPQPAYDVRVRNGHIEVTAAISDNNVV